MFKYIHCKLVACQHIYTDKIMLHDYIINFHVDITYLARRGHKCAIKISTYIVIPVSRFLCYHREPQSAAWIRTL